MHISVRLVLASVLAIATNPLPASETPSSTTEERIAQLETLWNQAHLKGDADALDRLWAPDITVIVPEMRPFTKPDLLKMWRSTKVVFTNYLTSGIRTHVYGDTVIVTGRLQRSRNFGGRMANEEWLFTKTYARIDGQWKVVAYHASTVPVS